MRCRVKYRGVRRISEMGEKETGSVNEENRDKMTHNT